MSVSLLRHAILPLSSILLLTAGCAILPPPPSSAAKFVRAAPRPEAKPVKGQVSVTSGLTNVNVGEGGANYLTMFHTEGNWTHDLLEHYTLATGVQNGVLLLEGLARLGGEDFNYGLLHGVGGLFSRDQPEGLSPLYTTMLQVNGGLFAQLRLTERGYLFGAARYTWQRYKAGAVEPQWLHGPGGSIGFLSQTDTTLSWSVELGYIRNHVLDSDTVNPEINDQPAYNLFNALFTVRADVL